MIFWHELAFCDQEFFGFSVKHIIVKTVNYKFHFKVCCSDKCIESTPVLFSDALDYKLSVVFLELQTSFTVALGSHCHEHCLALSWSFHWLVTCSICCLRWLPWAIHIILASFPVIIILIRRSHSSLSPRYLQRVHADTITIFICDFCSFSHKFKGFRRQAQSGITCSLVGSSGCASK